MKNAECRMKRAECRVQNEECRVQNEECRVQNAECRMGDTKRTLWILMKIKTWANKTIIGSIQNTRRTIQNMDA